MKRASAVNHLNESGRPDVEDYMQLSLRDHGLPDLFVTHPSFAPSHAAGVSAQQKKLFLLHGRLYQQPSSVLRLVSSAHGTHLSHQSVASVSQGKSPELPAVLNACIREAEACRQDLKLQNQCET